MRKEREQLAIAGFDAINAEDPRIDEGEPKALLYGRRMSARLKVFAPEASQTVRLAVRAQHLGRNRIERSAYPMNKPGYLTWRTELSKLHAQLAGDVMSQHGFSDDEIARVQKLIRKKGLRSDPEVQMLEDVACLVFLEHYFEAFAKEHAHEKLVHIVRKTWGKMSGAGHTAALKMDFPPHLLKIVQDALESSPSQ